MTAKLTMWIDKNKCTGSGLCLEECADLFVHDERGKALIKHGDQLVRGLDARVEISPEHQKAARAAYDACPTSAIGIAEG